MMRSIVDEKWTAALSGRSGWGWLTLLAAPALLACGGSGDWSSYQANTEALPEDTESAVTYPEGPYGTSKGSVVANLTFKEAIFDPELYCKKAVDYKIKNTLGVSSLSVSDIAAGDPLCPKKQKKFLWIISAAGW
jgi:hypothetical protein